MLYNIFIENKPYCLLAIVVLLIFYAVYFIKMIAQKKRGIQTTQIGKRKEKPLHRTEMLMSAATFSIVVIQLVSVLFGINHMPPSVRTVGFVIGLIGDAIFLAAVVCMRDSWRAGIPESDKTEIVTGGIYKFSRNPAFLGFDLMYIGVFMMYANIATAVFTAFAIIMLHFQILQEEKYLSATFGEEYAKYKSKVFRYFGRKHLL